ncbi:hypothetical protein ACG04R_23285 [Roseateles sp. BYS78W]|uniref:Uncharacterized protein n=1 Tax=Pelomonas candidula TaxID=3299025 RepID=A0ABW7HI76_9BURK
MADLPSRVEMAASIKEAARRLSDLCAIGAPEYLIETARRGLLRRLMDFPVNSEEQMIVLQEQHESRLAQENHLRETRFYGEDDEQTKALIARDDSTA